MPTKMRGIPGDERVDIQVGNRRLECRVVADRWWYDSEAIATTDREQEFFVTLAGKAKWQANFEGDRSLVKEREYALIFGMHAAAYVADLSAPIPDADMVEMFFAGSYEWKVNDVVIAEGDALELVGGPGFHSFQDTPRTAAALAYSSMGDKSQANLRKFWKPILVTGGRSVDFLYRVSAAVSADVKLMIKLYGLHLIPTGKKLTRTQAEARAKGKRR